MPKYIPPRLRQQQQHFHHSYSDSVVPCSAHYQPSSSAARSPFASPAKERIDTFATLQPSNSSGSGNDTHLPAFPEGFSPATVMNTTTTAFSTPSSPTRPLNARKAFGLEDAHPPPAFPASGSYVPNKPSGGVSQGRRGGAESWGLIRDE